MKSGKPRKAPKVKIYDPKKNFMREADDAPGRTSAQQPMTKKRLSR